MFCNFAVFNTVAKLTSMSQEKLTNIRLSPYLSCDSNNQGECKSFDRIGDSQHNYIRIDLHDNKFNLKTGDIAKVKFNCSTMIKDHYVLRDEYKKKNYDRDTQEVFFYVIIPEKGDNDKSLFRDNDKVFISKKLLFKRSVTGQTDVQTGTKKSKKRKKSKKSKKRNEINTGESTESKSNDGVDDPVLQLTNFGLDKKTAIQLLAISGNDIQKAANIYYNQTPGKKSNERKSDDGLDENFIKNEIKGMKKLYPLITEAQVKDIVAEAEKKADTNLTSDSRYINEEDPNSQKFYNDNYNKMYNKIKLELAATLFQSTTVGNADASEDKLEADKLEAEKMWHIIEEKITELKSIIDMFEKVLQSRKS